MSPKSAIPDGQLESLESEIREQYRERIEEKGTTPEGLFWDDADSMGMRFEAAVELVDFDDATVLDVGCGFGDFFGYLREREESPAEYHGVDVSEVVLTEARDRYGETPGVSFERRNVLLDPITDRRYDVVVLFGALGHNLEGIDNEAYLRRFMRTCYLCGDTVILNALSKYRHGEWPREEFVYYYDPGRVFGYAQELTRSVRLRHDFEPIPQKEFILLLEEDGSDQCGGRASLKKLVD